MDITPEDIAALRQQGDLRAYIDALTGRTSKPEVEQVIEEPFVPGPRHRPGAWPAGTRPSGPNTCHPDCNCALIPPEQT